MQFSAWRCSGNSTAKCVEHTQSSAVLPLLGTQRHLKGPQQQLLHSQERSPSQDWTDVTLPDTRRRLTDPQCFQESIQLVTAGANNARLSLHQLHLQRPVLPQHQERQQDSEDDPQSQQTQPSHRLTVQPSSQQPAVEHAHHAGQQQQQQVLCQEQQHGHPGHLQTQLLQALHQGQPQQQHLWGLDLQTTGGLTAAYVKLLRQHTRVNAAMQLGLADASSDAASSSSSSSTISRRTDTRASSSGSSTPRAAASRPQQQQWHWQLLLHHAQQLLPELQAHQLSLIVYAAAKVGNQLHHDWLRCVLQQQEQQQHLQLLPAAGLTNMLWSVAVMGLNPGEAWMTGFYAACSSRGLISLNYHQLTSILWSLGKMHERPPAEWLHQVLAVLRPSVSYLSPSELCNILWGLAQLGFRPSKGWTKDWFSASSRALPQCSPDHLACMAGSLALLRLDPRSGHWLRQYRAVVVQQLPAMRAAHVATIMCGLAKRRSSQVPYWVWLLVAHQVQRIEQQRQQHQQRLRQQQQQDHSGMTSAGVDSTATALKQEQRQHPQCSITTTDMAATVWALPVLLYPTAVAWKAEPKHGALLKALAAASLPMLPSCSAGELVQLAVGFARLRFYPGAHWLKVHENAVAAKYAYMSAVNRSRVRAAVKVMWSDV